MHPHYHYDCGQFSGRRLKFRMALALSAATFLAVAHNASGQELRNAPEGTFTNVKRWDSLCGAQGMLPNVTHVPSIGCFRLSAGNRAEGEFAGHVLTVNVDARGEACQVDGATFSCSGCIDSARDGCSAMLTVHSRDGDGSVNFFVSRRIREGGSFVTNQENLDASTRTPAANSGTGTAAIPLPSGPYSSWPEESRMKAVATLSARCALVSGMQFVDYKGPQEASLELRRAMTAACVDHQMPDDWPGHAQIQASEKERLESARRLDPSFAWTSNEIDDVWRDVADKAKAGAADGDKH